MLSGTTCLRAGALRRASVAISVRFLTFRVSRKLSPPWRDVRQMVYGAFCPSVLAAPLKDRVKPGLGQGLLRGVYPEEFEGLAMTAL